jgi:hypothetical protein
MKTQSKPIVALASSALLVCGVLCQSAQAQSIIVAPTTVNLADVNGVDSGPTALPVTYEVTQFTSGPYTGDFQYSYIISPDAALPAYVLGFNVGFNTGYAGALVGGTITGGINSQNSEFSGVSWNTQIEPGAAPSSANTLSFISDNSPVLGDANATGSDTPGPWASAPDGAQVAVPYTPAVPEPATTSLLGMAFLVPTFGRRLFRARNFKK